MGISLRKGIQTLSTGALFLFPLNLLAQGWRGYIPEIKDDRPRPAMDHPVSLIPKDILDRGADAVRVLSIEHPSLYATAVLRGQAGEEISIIGVSDSGERAILRRVMRSKDGSAMTFVLLKRVGRYWRDSEIFRRTGGDFWKDVRFRVDPIDLTADGKYLVYTYLKPHSFFGRDLDLILAVLNTESGESSTLKAFEQSELNAADLPASIAAGEWFRSQYPDANYDEVFHRSGERCLAASNLEAAINGDSSLAVRKTGVRTRYFPLTILTQDPSAAWDPGQNHFNSADCSMGLMTLKANSPLYGFQQFVVEFGLSP